MKRPIKQILTKALAFMLLSSSPVNVLSTMAYANAINSTVDSTEVVTTTSPADSTTQTVDTTVTPSDGVSTDTSTTDTSVPQPPSPTVPPTSTVPDVPTATPVDATTPTTQTDPSAPSQSTPTDTFDASKLMSDASTYEEKLQLVDDAIELFKKEQTLESLEKAIDLYVYLPIMEESDYVTDKPDYANTLTLFIPFLSAEDQPVAKEYFATKTVEMAERTLDSTDAGIALDAVNALPNGKVRDELKKRLQAVLDTIKQNSNTGDLINDQDGVLDEYTPDPAPTGDNTTPDYNPDDFTKPVVNPVPFEQGTWTTDNQTGSDIPTQEGMDKNWDSNFNGQVNGDYYNGSGGSGSGSSLVNEQQKQAEELTIHYTLDKNAKNPRYYDTKVVVNAEQTINYENAKDALYQIAVQSKGKFVDDVKQSLALIDGRIIAIKDNGKPLPLKDFVALFNDTKVGIVAMKGIGGEEELSAKDLMEQGGVVSVLVNNKEVALPDQPILDNHTVLYPIKEIAEALGGKVKVETEKTTIQYRHNTLTFEDGKLYAVKNDKQLSLKVSSRTSQKGVRIAPIEPLLDMFGATLLVKDHTVTLSTK